MKDLQPYGGKTPDLALMLSVAEKSLNSLRAGQYHFSGQLKKGQIVLYSESFHDQGEHEPLTDVEWQLQADLTGKNVFHIELFNHGKAHDREAWGMEPIKVLYMLRSEESAKMYFEHEIKKHRHSGDGTKKMVKDLFSFMGSLSGGDE
jgi:hypothetical protein